MRQETAVARAIETHYNGWHFRSRLEARWAVFMDALGVSYVYEPEVFDLGMVRGDSTFSGNTVRYLPDFWLPGVGCYLEIKPHLSAALAAWEKLMLLSLGTGKRVIVQWGPPSVPEDFRDVQTSTFGATAPPDSGEYFWCEVAACGCVGIEFEGRTDRIGCPHMLHRANVGYLHDRGHNVETPRLRAAVRAARSSRFGS